MIESPLLKKCFPAPCRRGALFRSGFLQTPFSGPGLFALQSGLDLLEQAHHFIHFKVPAYDLPAYQEYNERHQNDHHEI